jgi:hypothetical protein
MEGKSVSHDDIYPIFENEGYCINLVQSLQDAHDGAAMDNNFLYSLEKRLLRISIKYNLTYTNPNSKGAPQA